MKKILNNKILLVILFILIIIVGCVLYFEYSNKDNIGSLYVNDSIILKDENNKNSFNDTSNLDEGIYKNDDIDKSDYDDISNIDISISEKHNYNNIYENNVSYIEDDVVDYFAVMNDEISESESFKDIFKEYFIIIVDFIFYDKDIKGYTFNELSNIAKIKIISYAFKIDAKIEEFLPNYKQNISNISSNVYNNIKEKFIYLYMDISSSICKDNEEECNNVKIIWSEVKDVCDIGLDILKNIAFDSTEKLKNWYEIYNGKK